MRSLIFCLALAIAASTAYQAADAATGDEATAQQIAKNLKQSGKLKDYRVGVKYEDGTAWLMGTVTSERQKKIAEQLARESVGVDQIISKLEVEGAPEVEQDRVIQVASNDMASSNRRPQRSRGTTNRRRARNNMPVPYARSGQTRPRQNGRGVQPVNYSQQARQIRPQAPTAAGQSVSYDNPQMPGYAWPSYAASPNYAALTYPKQYSASAWPYIGPFYPYPQVPLGWRKVTLEWDDGWWFLDFKDQR